MKLLLVGVASLALLGCRTPKASTTPAVLTGRVLDGQGAPISGVEVQLFSGIGTLFRQGTTRTDADGRYRFEIENAAARRDEVTHRWVGMMWLATQHDRFASSDDSMCQIDVPLDRGTVVKKDFAMVDAGAIEGVLMSSTTGAPIAQGLRIYIGDPHAVHFLRYATADEHGRFTERGLYPGDYTIDVNCANDGAHVSYPVLGTVRIEAGKTAKVELRW